MNVTAHNQIVHPLRSGWETLLLVCCLGFLISLTFIYASTWGHVDHQQELLDWEISGYSDLKGADQAIYNELLTAGEEIYYMQYYLGSWPDMPDFQDALLPPFYQDLSWERNGSVKWTLKDVLQEGEAQGLTIYHGNQGAHTDQGAYLLVVGHVHAGNSQSNQLSVWWHPDRFAPLPQYPKQTSFILEGWKRVKPYQGRDEVERLKGD